MNFELFTAVKYDGNGKIKFDFSLHLASKRNCQHNNDNYNVLIRVIDKN